MTSRFQRAALMALAASALAGGLSACAPLVIGGAMVGGTLIAVDRRTSGTQIEDEGIEFRATNRTKDAMGDKAHVNITSYNRQVLLTGEASTAEQVQAIEKMVRGLEGVHSVVNELAALPASSLVTRSGDTFITGKVRASLVDAKDLTAGAFKVVTERNVVYLMGRVTQREAQRASDIARGVNGVSKVVRVFEYLTEDELVRLSTPRPAPVTTDKAPSSRNEP